MGTSVDKTGLSHITRKIRTAYKHPYSKEVRIFLVFFVLSFLFWWLQSLQEVRELEVRVPVVFTEITPEITITSNLPEYITVTLSDKGTNLYHYLRHRKDLTITINTLDYLRNQDVGEVTFSAMESLLRNKILASTQINSINPEHIRLYFAKNTSVQIPVRLRYSLSFAPQHQLAKAPSINPSVVKVFAPSGILKSLKYLDTEVLIEKSLDDTTSVWVALKPVNGVRFAQQKVKATFCVEEFTEQSLEVPVQGVHFPKGSIMLTFPSFVKLSYFVGLSAYKHTKSTDFKAVVDYNDWEKSGSNRVAVRLLRQPSGLKNMRIQPATVECLLEKNTQ